MTSITLSRAVRIRATPISEGRMTKSSYPPNQRDEVPHDIRERILADFGPEQADTIFRYLLDRIPDGLPNGNRPRHLRCILYLARGDRALLDSAIELCLTDTRDVMLAAEYDTTTVAHPRRRRDFGKPFAQAELPKAKKKRRSE
jgi:hypothetical protein